VGLGAPVDGIVKHWFVKTIGGVITPGSLVAEVLPVSERREAFTRVKPQEIGPVGIGQKVESISAGTFQDENIDVVARTYSHGLW
jgi:hypothetical protein